MPQGGRAHQNKSDGKVVVKKIVNFLQHCQRQARIIASSR
jgi:hypothetical protein